MRRVTPRVKLWREKSKDYTPNGELFDIADGIPNNAASFVLKNGEIWIRVIPEIVRSDFAPFYGRAALPISVSSSREPCAAMSPAAAPTTLGTGLDGFSMSQRHAEVFNSRQPILVSYIALWSVSGYADARRSRRRLDGMPTARWNCRVTQREKVAHGLRRPVLLNGPSWFIMYLGYWMFRNWLEGGEMARETQKSRMRSPGSETSRTSGDPVKFAATPSIGKSNVSSSVVEPGRMSRRTHVCESPDLMIGDQAERRFDPSRCPYRVFRAYGGWGHVADRFSLAWSNAKEKI